MATNSIGSSSSMRMAGLVSGLDTETLVKQMASGTKSKINTQKQKLQLLQWKQESYRSVISKVSTFKSTYFNILNQSTNLSSSAVFAARAATSSNSLVSAISSSSASTGSYNITNVAQRAKAATVSSTAQSIEGIKLDFSNAADGETHTIKLTLDGLTKDVSFTGGADVASTQQNLVDAINGKFSSTGAEFSMDGSRLVARTASNPSLVHTFSIAALSTTSDNTELAALGLTQGVSSKASTTVGIGTLAFATELKGDSHTFEINGKKFAFDSNSTISQIISSVNSSDAGVKLSYSSISGKFSLAATSSGAGSNIEIKQTSGNLLTSMFGESNIAASSSISTRSLMSSGVQGEASGFTFDNPTINNADLANKKVSVTINGETKTIGLWQYDAAGVKNDFSKSSTVISQLNSQISKEFGSAAASFKYDSDTNTFTLVGADSSDEVTISAIEDTSGGSAALVAALGFNAENSTNVLDTSAALVGDLADGEAFNIKFNDGTTVSLTNQTSIDSLVADSNGKISYENGRLIFQGLDYADSDSDAQHYLSGLFGDKYNFPGVPPFPDMSAQTSAVFNGQNAIITINGTTLSNSSNSITIDGTTIDVSKLTEGATDITVTVTNDTSKAMAAIKQFVADYNSLISDVYGETSTKYDRSYKPLTEEQQEEMSDTEVENWNKQAKTGVLYQDQTVNNFLSKLRQAVSGSAVNGTGLWDMGIKVSSSYSDNGKLEIDEAALQKALEQNPEKIQQFFTDPEKGFAARVSAVVDSAIATGATPGTLTRLAGVANTTTAVNNSITKQIESYKKAIDTLQTKYKSEMERYWSNFTTLETSLSKYESQSSYIASMFSTNS